MKKLLLLAVALAFGYLLSIRDHTGPADAPARDVAVLQDHATTGQVSGSGTVIRIFPDDVSGGRHQRFLLRLPSGRTLLVAHNIDIAPRVEPLHEGDVVEYLGEFAWNPKGGVVHWTHHDPSGRHPAGWLRHDGRTFQ
jgi:hypothetical protein